MMYSKKYGPCIRIAKGEVGKATVVRLIENEAGNGFTALLVDGGVLSLLLTPEAQEKHRRKSREDWPEERRNKALGVLNGWANAQGKAYRHGLESHAAQANLAYSEIKAAFFLNPGRVEPPLRAEYERALARRRDTFNALKSQRRAGKLGK